MRETKRLFECKEKKILLRLIYFVCCLIILLIDRAAKEIKIKDHLISIILSHFYIFIYLLFVYK